MAGAVSGVALAPAARADCPWLLDLVGDTPVARICAPLPVAHGGFWAKLECLGPGGMKARAAVSMLVGARRRGDLSPGAAVVESTSGTMGIGLALAGTALGHPVVLVCDVELEPMMRSLLRAHGARLEIVEHPDPVSGWQGARNQRLQSVLAELDGSWWANQYDNPDNPAGYAGLAAELIARFRCIDTLVCSVGTGGHSAGIVRALRARWPDIRLVGVDTVGSTIFGQPARSRVMRGLGSSIHPRNVAYDQFEEVHWVGPVEAVHACRALARDAFVTGGWSTGAVAVVAAWHARRSPTEEVVAVFPDGPQRYWSTIFDDGFCQSHELLDAQPRSAPVEIGRPEAVEVDGWSRCLVVVDPLCPAEATTHSRVASRGREVA